MQLEIGKIYTGKVKGIAQYGAFVDIDGGRCSHAKPGRRTLCI